MDRFDQYITEYILSFDINRNSYIVCKRWKTIIDSIKIPYIDLPDYVDLPFSFLERNIGQDGWGYISRNSLLSEKFIEKHSEKVNWLCISYSQKLSEDFIERHSDRIEWNSLLGYQNLSDAFIDKHWNRFLPDRLSSYLKTHPLTLI